MGRSDGSGSAAILAAAVGYGLSTTLSVAVLRQIAPADLLAVELGGGATLLVVTAAALGRLTRAGSARNLLLGILAPGLAFVLGDLGLSWTSATSGSLLLATEVPLSVVLAVVFLREAVDRTGRWALVCGFAGTALVALGAGRHDDGVATVGGNVFVVLSVAASAVFLVVTRRLNNDDGLNASTWQTVGGALGAAPFVVLNWWHEGSRLGGASPGSWWLAGGILVLTALASFSFNWGISRVEGVRAAQLGNLTPLAGLVSAVVLLGERPGALQLVGGALALGAVVLLVHADGRPAPSAVESTHAPLASHLNGENHDRRPRPRGPDRVGRGGVHHRLCHGARARR